MPWPVPWVGMTGARPSSGGRVPWASWPRTPKTRGGGRRAPAGSGGHTAGIPSPFEIACRLFFFNDTATTEIYTLSLHDALPILYRIDGWLEVSAGLALKLAIDALARPLGGDDRRSPKQRRADAVVELAQHAKDQGRLPARHGVRPHLSVHTTIEGLKGELGAPASQLQEGTPISSKTVQRLACDGTLHRVLKADSMVIDVGRAKRMAQPAQWRGPPAPRSTRAPPGCDPPLGWTYAPHVAVRAEGGP